MIRAVHYAITAHGAQKRSGTDLPYIIHPVEVACILTEHNVLGHTTICAAVLHDVIEDTESTYGDVVDHFGVYIADLVEEVTDDGTLSKKEQRAAGLARLPSLSVPAHHIKLADGISNVRATDFNRPGKWSRSLKLAYVKTVMKGGDVIRDTFIQRDIEVPSLYYTLCKEVADARVRLSKANYK